MLKKAGISFYLNLAACLLLIVGFILAIVSNAKPGFSYANATSVMIFSAVGLIAFLASVFCELKFGTHHMITFFVKWIAVLAVSIAFCLIAETRISNAGNLLSWDTENKVGLSALYNGFAAIILYVASVVLFIVTTFIKEKKA